MKDFLVVVNEYEFLYQLHASWFMKSFLLRFDGLIFALAQIQKMQAKMSEKIMWSTFMGRLTKFELKNPLGIFIGERKTCSFTCKLTMKRIESYYFTEFWGF